MQASPIKQIIATLYCITQTSSREHYIKRKNAVGGRFGAFGSLPFFSFLAFFNFGSVELPFFLQKEK
jgi:hypothetical protein